MACVVWWLTVTSLQRGMLAQLAARLRARQDGGDGAGDVGGVVLGDDGEAIVVDDNCLVRLRIRPLVV